MKKELIMTFVSEPFLALKLIYRNDKLCKIEGIEKIKNIQIYAYFPLIAPLQFSDIEAAKERFGHRINYSEVIKEKTLFQNMTASWMEFFQKRFGIQAQFRNIEGKAINGIIAYLREICNDDSEVLAVFQNILNRWDELDQFTQSKCELTYINSKLASIIIQLKSNGQSDRTI